MKFFESKNFKVIESEDYNSFFRKNDGFFLRWGKTKEDDPSFSPFGPELADIEITTICNGVKQLDGTEHPCSFCYKSNTRNGKNMSFETFKSVIDKFPKINNHWLLTQVALGADSHATSNPDLWKMMEYCRSVGIIPNITVADISDETADNLVKYCGAVAVSRYAQKDLCYDSVKRLTDRGLTQCNIHIMVSNETENMVWETMHDSKTDDRLKGLNAIVLLSLKKKGRGRNFTQLSVEGFRKIVKFALENKIGIGFDSCSQPKFLASVKEHPDCKYLEMLSEPCEAVCMSFFVNVDGKGFPCSFAEGTDDWVEGVDILNCEDFIKDIWNNERINRFRETLLHCNRSCFLYEV